MKFKPSMTALTFDLVGYKQELNTALKKELQQAIKHWLRSAIKPTVPTWSGASRATFAMISKLAEEPMTYGAQKSRKNRKALGERESSATLTGDKDTGIYSFEWGTTLRYFILNNNSFQQYVPGAKDTGSGKILYKTGLTRPGPYNLEQKGEVALREALKTVSLPSPIPFIKARKL